MTRRLVEGIKNDEPWVSDLFPGGEFRVVLRSAVGGMEAPVDQDRMVQIVAAISLHGRPETLDACVEVVGRTVVRRAILSAEEGDDSLAISAALNNMHSAATAVALLDRILSLAPELTNRPAFNDGGTPAHLLVEYASIEGFEIDTSGVIDVLARYRGDFDQRDEDGMTPAEAARSAGLIWLADELDSAQASALLAQESPDPSKRTPDGPDL